MTRLALALALVLPSCTREVSLFGPPTEAPCPPASALTYDGFGRDFMARYCTRCHDRDLRAEDRQGAPSFHDFDFVQGVRALADHIDETSAAGPAGINTSMPPDEPRPSEAERYLLGAWLACGAP